MSVNPDLFPLEDGLFLAFRDAHDTRALERLYEGTASWLFRLCYRILGDRDAAKDAMQTAWETVLRRRHHFNPTRGRFVNMLYTYGKNEALKLLASRRRNESLGDDEGGTLPPVMPQRPAPAGLPADIRDALELLPTRDRDVIYLHYFAGFSVHDIATQFGHPDGAIKTWLYRARRKLKPLLAPVLLLAIGHFLSQHG